MITGSFAYPSFVSILPYRPEFENEHPYGAPQLDVPVCLNVNENPYAPSAELVADIAHAVAEAASKLNRYPDRDFMDLRQDLADYLAEDTRIRTHIENRLSHAGISSITIRKDANEVEVNIHTARPGIVIGKSGSEVDALRRDLHRLTNKSVKVNILEI